MPSICGHDHDAHRLGSDIETYAALAARSRGFCQAATVEALTRAAMLYAAKTGCPCFSEFVRRIEEGPEPY